MNVVPPPCSPSRTVSELCTLIGRHTLLLEQEALEEAQEAVRFHADALASALTERTALDGPWGLLARVWRTHAHDVAHCDARIAYHHQQLQQAKARLIQADNAHDHAPSDEEPSHREKLEAVAAHLLTLDHPLRDRLQTVDAELATLDAAHALDARLHRTGTALLSAVRSRTEPTTATGLTALVARWLSHAEDPDAHRRAFASACDDAAIPFEGGASMESQADQAEHILAALRDRAIEHVQERRVLESGRARVLEEASEILPTPPPLSPSSPEEPNHGTHNPPVPPTKVGG